MSQQQVIVLTGIIGAIAAIVVGVGEFMLHFDPLARFSADGYEFMLAGSEQRQTLGHFFGVLGAPLYVVGCWHIYLMLKPANQKLAFVGFLASAYGFMIGADWISSRASIGALVHYQESGGTIEGLVSLYRKPADGDSYNHGRYIDNIHISGSDRSFALPEMASCIQSHRVAGDEFCCICD